MMGMLIDLRDRQPIFERRYALGGLSVDGATKHYRLDDLVVLPYGSFGIDFFSFHEVVCLAGEERSFHFWSAMLDQKGVESSDFVRNLAERFVRDPSADLVYFNRYNHGSDCHLEPHYALKWPAGSLSEHRWIWILYLADFNRLRDVVDASSENAFREVKKILNETLAFGSYDLLTEKFSCVERGYSAACLADKCCLIDVVLRFGIPEYSNRGIPVAHVRAYDVLRKDIYGSDDDERHNS